MAVHVPRKFRRADLSGAAGSDRIDEPGRAAGDRSTRTSPAGAGPLSGARRAAGARAQGLVERRRRPLAAAAADSRELARLAGELRMHARRENRQLDELDLAILHEPKNAKTASACGRSTRPKRSTTWSGVGAHRADRGPDTRAAARPELAAERNRAPRACPRARCGRPISIAARAMSRATRPNGRWSRSWLPDGTRGAAFFARGGMGKSLAAELVHVRRCALLGTRAPDAVRPDPLSASPCARVDFDAIQPTVDHRLPLIMLLEFAASSTGSPTAPRSRSCSRRMVDHPIGAAAEPQRGRLQNQAAQGPASDGEDVASRFVAALQRRARDRPVVFVLDTFEEALRPAVHPEELLALMSRGRRAKSGRARRDRWPLRLP